MPDIMLPILGTAVATFILTITLILFFVHTGQAIPFLPKKIEPAAKPASADDLPKPKYPDLYRVSSIPLTYDKEDTRLLLQSILGCHLSSLVVHSLGDDPRGKPNKIAAFTLPGGSPYLSGRGRRWTFPIPEEHLSKKKVQQGKGPIVIDDHFEGFTPMNSFGAAEEHKLEWVIISLCIQMFGVLIILALSLSQDLGAMPMAPS